VAPLEGLAWRTAGGAARIEEGVRVLDMDIA
jgi:hypothetical protein